VRKLIVGIGLVLLATGMALLAFPTQEASETTVDVKEWNLQSKTLGPQNSPQNSTFYGTFMRPGMWFQLGVSSSDFVQLNVSVLQNPGIRTPFLIKEGTSFDQKVTISQTGTYVVDIRNINPYNVTLDGKVIVRETETNYRTTNPYAFPGFIVTLGGTAAMAFGIFKKPKRASKPKRTTTK